jgi:hypothetical protein
MEVLGVARDAVDYKPTLDNAFPLFANYKAQLEQPTYNWYHVARTHLMSLFFGYS